MSDKKTSKGSKSNGFQSLGLSKELLRGILNMGYKVSRLFHLYPTACVLHNHSSQTCACCQNERCWYKYVMLSI